MLTMLTSDVGGMIREAESTGCGRGCGNCS